MLYFQDNPHRSKVNCWGATGRYSAVAIPNCYIKKRQISWGALQSGTGKPQSSSALDHPWWKGLYSRVVGKKVTSQSNWKNL